MIHVFATTAVLTKDTHVCVFQGYMESEDWADLELRELRSVISAGINPQAAANRRCVFACRT